MTGSLPPAPEVHNPNPRMLTDFESLQRSTVQLVLPGVFLAVILLGAVASGSGEYIWPLSTALFLLVMAVLIWLVSRVSFVWASILLALVSLAAVAAAILWGDIPEAAVLLFIPTSLVTICFGAGSGGLAAVLLTAFLSFSPGLLASIPAPVRVVSILSMWAGVGLLWLALRPLLSAVEWSWQAYGESRRLLEQARDYQGRLMQALDDLTQANGQLNRLNELANNLRHAAEEERRIKEQFVANVSHELRTPLNMVIGFCEMILKSPDAYAGTGGQKLPSSLLADLQVILRNSQHLSSLIDDVLDLSQIEAGQMALVKEMVEIESVVNAAATAVRPLYESKHLYLKVHVEEGLPPLYCDRTRIREVLLNLLSNAGRFTGEGGVTLSVRREAGSVVFSVQDTGPGISPQDQEKLFKPFQQLDPSIRRKHGGTGLGLSISKSFVEMHDGKMWVKSSEGSGTTFFFCLPVESTEMPQTGYLRWVNPYLTYEKRTRPAYQPEIDRRPRLIVIEKGAILKRLFTRYLPGVEILGAADMQEAEHKLEINPARMVVVNQSPGDDHVASLSAVSIAEDTPVIFCSVADPIDYAPAPDMPEILVKPISQDALLSALDKVAAVRPLQSVLLVEDEPDAQKLFVRMLTSSGRGYRVARAGNGAQALRILERQPVDLILLDLVMPEMDGYQFLRARAEDPKLQAIPIILISAKDTRGHPIVSSFVAGTRSGGISVQQLIDSVQALGALLSPGLPAGGDPGS